MHTWFFLDGHFATPAEAAAIEYGSRPENAGKTVVTIICDFGERYIQTMLFDAFRYEGSDDVE